MSRESYLFLVIYKLYDLYEIPPDTDAAKQF